MNSLQFKPLKPGVSFVGTFRKYREDSVDKTEIKSILEIEIILYSYMARIIWRD